MSRSLPSHPIDLRHKATSTAREAGICSPTLWQDEEEVVWGEEPTSVGDW